MSVQDVYDKNKLSFGSLIDYLNRLFQSLSTRFHVIILELLPEFILCGSFFIEFNRFVRKTKECDIFHVNDLSIVTDN